MPGADTDDAVAGTPVAAVAAEGQVVPAAVLVGVGGAVFGSLLVFRRPRPEDAAGR